MSRHHPTLLAGALLALLALPACGGPDVPDHQGGGAILTEDHPEVRRIPGWLDFTDLSLHTDAEPNPPLEPYVRGTITGSRFYPDGEIVGPKERPGGRRILIEGWLDLRTRAFYTAAEDQAPTPPYVPGVKDRDGAFFPVADIVHGPAPAGN